MAKEKSTERLKAEYNRSPHLQKIFETARHYIQWYQAQVDGPGEKTRSLNKRETLV